MTDPPDPELFREVFGRFATGVAAITTMGPEAGR
jgi:flavin reductase (DIM6/NTAB) family NADH-FMN oxidoreductase RutF